MLPNLVNVVSVTVESSGPAASHHRRLAGGRHRGALVERTPASAGLRDAVNHPAARVVPSTRRLARKVVAMLSQGGWIVDLQRLDARQDAEALIEAAARSRLPGSCIAPGPSNSTGCRSLTPTVRTRSCWARASTGSSAAESSGSPPAVERLYSSTDQLGRRIGDPDDCC